MSNKEEIVDFETLEEESFYLLTEDDDYGYIAPICDKCGKIAPYSKEEWYRMEEIDTPEHNCKVEEK